MPVDHSRYRAGGWLVACWLALAPLASAQTEGQLDASETLFTVMAAINAAGYDADIDSPFNHPLRAQVRQYLASRKLASVEKLRAFYDQHRQDNPAAELSQYISFALLVKGPPTFEYKWLTYQLPPDVQALEGLGPLLAEFYREANIHQLWLQAQPAFDEVIARYHEPVSRTVLELNAYTRSPTSGVPGRRFQIYVCLLAAPHQVHTRSYRGDYFIVITPSAELQLEEIRYFYLYYLLEPVVARAEEQLERVRALADYAQGAPHLPQHYKDDFVLLTTACLVKAILIRLEPVPPEKKAAMVEEAYRRGYILTPHFWEQLPQYERQEQALRFYFPQMVKAIDLRKEEARAQNLVFIEEPPPRRVYRAEMRAAELTGPEKLLEEAEELYRQRQLEAAREKFLAASRDSRDSTIRARAFYGLARIAVLQNDPELAVRLFEQVLELSPPPVEKAWTLVYLGRLSDVAGEHDKARQYYEKALEVEGASEKARETARQGLGGAFRRSPQQQEP